MKKKIFFVALILFSVFLDSMILIVSNMILKDKLSTVRDKCLAEHYVIASSLIGDMQALDQRGKHDFPAGYRLQSGKTCFYGK